jgi:hypothetical protein
MRARVPSLMMRPTPLPLLVRVVVIAALIAAETLVVYPLRQVAPEISLGLVYLPGVLVVSSVSGLTLGVVTAVLRRGGHGLFRRQRSAYEHRQARLRGRRWSHGSS